MQTVYAYPNPEHLKRIMWAVNKVEDNVEFLRMETPRSMAIDCQRHLIAAIVSQKYVGEWSGRARQYHPRYRVWKETYGRAGGMKFWILWGDLLGNIKVFKYSSSRQRGFSWMAGVQAGVKDQGGKSWLGRGKKGKSKPIAWYGRILEWGGEFGAGGYHPPRPVFSPTLRDFHRDEGPKYLRRMVPRVLRAWS